MIEHAVLIVNNIMHIITNIYVIGCDEKGFPFVLISPLQIIVDTSHRNVHYIIYLLSHYTINCTPYANIHYIDLKACTLVRPRVFIQAKVIIRYRAWVSFYFNIIDKDVYFIGNNNINNISPAVLKLTESQLFFLFFFLFLFII